MKEEVENTDENGNTLWTRKVYRMGEYVIK